MFRINYYDYNNFKGCYKIFDNKLRGISFWKHSKGQQLEYLNIEKFLVI